MVLGVVLGGCFELIAVIILVLEYPRLTLQVETRIFFHGQGMEILPEEAAAVAAVKPADNGDFERMLFFVLPQPLGGRIVMEIQVLLMEMVVDHQGVHLLCPLDGQLLVGGRKLSRLE